MSKQILGTAIPIPMRLDSAMRLPPPMPKLRQLLVTGCKLYRWRS